MKRGTIKRRLTAATGVRRKTLRLKPFKLRGLRGKKGLTGAKPMRPGTGSRPLLGKTGLT